MTLVTAIAGQKGGTGKTTTAISLASGLARKGRGATHVLLIDADSQANASKVLVPNYAQLRVQETIYQTIIEEQPLPIRSTVVAGLDLVPAHIMLSSTDVELSKNKDEPLESRATRLKRQLDRVK